MKLVRLTALTALVVLSLPALAAKSLTVRWTAPATALDGTALTGTQALTKYEVWVSDTAIPDVPTTPATATIAPANTTVATVVTLPAGSTAHVRMRACNAFGCSPLTAEATGTVPGSMPGLPTEVTIEIIQQ